MAICLRLDLKAPAITNLLQHSCIYCATNTVHAIRLTDTTLASLASSGNEIFFDQQANNYMYWLCDEKGNRTPPLPIHPGDWLVTEPSQYGTEHSTIFIANEASFFAWYAPTDQPDRYRSRQLLHAVKNPAHIRIEALAYWGGKQSGDMNCYICAVVDPSCPDDTTLAQRFLMSAEEFTDGYQPVEEVLGTDWRTKLLL